jgi:hypothetical protein
MIDRRIVSGRTCERVNGFERHEPWAVVRGAGGLTIKEGHEALVLFQDF